MPSFFRDKNENSVAIIDAQLDLLRRSEAQYQKIIEEVQALKASVQLEKKGLEAQREEMMKLRIPIYRVPPELLTRIFLLAIQSDFGDHDNVAQMGCFWAPFRLSHVCCSWYNLIVSTQELWSFIFYPGTCRSSLLLQESLRRSKLAPLHILHRVTSDTDPSDDVQRARKSLANLLTHSTRIQAFDFQCLTVYAMVLCLDSLKDLFSTPTTPPLETLSLSLLSETSLGCGLGSLYTGGKAQYSTTHTFQHPSPVKSLKCEHLIPFRLPPQIFVNLTRLELSFAPRKHAQTIATLPMSALCRFLHHTPRLEQLVIFDTTPDFDVVPIEPKVPLVHLHAFEWSDPPARDVTRFMSFLYTPSLAEIDLWLNKYIQSSSVRHSPSPDASPNPLVLEYPSVKEICLRLLCEDPVSYVFGKFLFPALERMEISNIGDGSKVCRNDEQHLPPLPPLSDIFRDPRLSNLTHLTLSWWRIPSDIGIARALLGYIPALTSLTIERCLNVGILLQCLQEHVLVQFIKKAAPQQRCDVKFCPKLEALTFLGCDDVEFACLRELVLARNRSAELTRYAGPDLGAVLAPNDMPRLTSKAGENPGAREGGAESFTHGRVILPLRKGHRQGRVSLSSGLLGSTQGGSGAVPNVISGVDVIEKTSQRVHILYLRIQDCKLISQVKAESLKALDVLDVIWS